MCDCGHICHVFMASPVRVRVRRDAWQMLRGTRWTKEGQSQTELNVNICNWQDCLQTLFAPFFGFPLFKKQNQFFGQLVL